MTRSLFRTTLVALLLTAVSASPARSDSWFSSVRRGKKKTTDTQSAAGSRSALRGQIDDDDDDADDDDNPKSVLTAYEAPGYATTAPNPLPPNPAMMGAGGCYPTINSSLYPCPRPDIPYEVGQTFITNQAFYPHEFLYAHRYRAIYPPYFYKNTCGLACLPFFPKPCIKGTVVTVKYKSTLPCSFNPPFGSVKRCFSNTQWR